MNKLSVAHANDLTVFHSMIRYDQQGHGNADYRCLLLFKGVCALCNKVLEVYTRETWLEKAEGGFHPEGVKDRVEYYRKVLAPMYWDEGEALRTASE